MIRLYILLLCGFVSYINAQLCSVTTGQDIIILDIAESLGDQVDQKTTPEDLTIEGSVGIDITLRLDNEGSKYFTLNNTQLSLIKPIDRDGEQDSLRFQIMCSVIGVGEESAIPVIVRITDINDNPPIFSGLPYAVTIPEVEPVGSTIFSKVLADDIDAGVNGQVVYSIIPGGNIGDGIDGYNYFNINLPHQGLVTINTSLDYEKASLYYVTILAKDRAESNPLTSTATLTVQVADSDDQDPVFEYESCPRVGSICANPEYTAAVTSGVVSGVLSVRPERIHAADQDSIASEIRYSFLSGRPGTYDRHFAINPQSGAVTHTTVIDRAVTQQFEITVKAEEQSPARRFATARLVISVKGVDSSPPVVISTSYSGTVDENSRPGTPVYDSHPNPKPIILSVSDPDLTTPGNYTWELTTTAFRIGDGGQLEVAEDSSLDRDPPNPGVYTFQIVAREAWDLAGVASAPITVTVELNDVNDNPPRLPVYPPLAVEAGAARRVITKVTAKDNDAGENSIVTYSISYVSNSGFDKFSINETSGELALVGEVVAGDQYSVTLRATDSGGLFTESIIEVTVNRGPNKGGPVFTLPRYSATISEGAPLNSALITLSALDPEGDSTRFTLLDQQDFEIGSSSGTIRVVKELDRETQDRYTLVVTAADPEGITNTATVAVTIEDMNDRTPEFVGTPYSFRVSEGTEAEVGTVLAVDNDVEQNGEVLYSVPEESPFTISDSGVIRTKQALDYEKQQVHYLVVTARDGAAEPRQATSTVTILVGDTGDEPPIFKQKVYEASIEENIPDATLVTVTAVDPDTTPSITYTMVNGDPELFSVDPVSGRISTSRGLDYETSSRHTLIIGTLENPGGPRSTSTVLISVLDANDNPPVFSLLVPPRKLPETSPPGTLVVTLLATDSDGTRPNNLIEYEMTGYGRALDFFSVTNDSGVISLIKDLKMEPDTDFDIEIVARDQGSPQLSTTSTVSISIDRPGELKTISEELFPAFPDTELSLEILEDTKLGKIIRTIPIINNPNVNNPKNNQIRCLIIEGNEDDNFGIDFNNLGCDLVLKKPLDYETRNNYTLEIKLEAPISPTGEENRNVEVNIGVTDVNDNFPRFIFTRPYSDISSDKYFGFVTQDTEIGSPVVQVSAEDSDEGEFGRIEFEIVPESNRGGYFSIDRKSGLIRTERLMDSVPRDLLPFNLTLRALDNPLNKPSGNSETSGSSEISGNSETLSGNSHATTVPLIINLVEDIHQMVLVVEAAPTIVRERQDELIAVLQEHSNHIIGIEKIEARRYIGNTSIVSDTDSSDIFFHLVNSESGNILNRHHPQVQKLKNDRNDLSTLLYHVTAALGGSRATGVRSPELMAPVIITPSPPARAGIQLEGFQIALMVLAGVIVILGVVGICYICIQWRRYMRHRSKASEASKAVVVVAPPYERVGSVCEPVEKEYEVQVLHMSVPLDDDSLQDFTIDSRNSNRSHHFSMDNVSYITKQQLSEASSDEDMTPRDMTPRDMTPRDDWNGGHESHNSHQFYPHQLPASTPRNAAYNPYGDESLDGNFSASVSNENVMFGRRGLTDPSPVQTTTEL